MKCRKPPLLVWENTSLVRKWLKNFPGGNSLQSSGWDSASTAVGTGSIPGGELRYYMHYREKTNLSEVDTVIDYMCQGGRLKEWEKTR